MISLTVAFFLNLLFWGLRISGRGGTFPRRLSVDEEAELWARKQAGDKEAEDLLIEHNMRLVTHIARKYYASESDYEDLLSQGNIGLINAVRSFNPENGAKFATYACRCIQNEFRMKFRKMQNAPKMSSLDETYTDDENGPVPVGTLLCVEDDNLTRIDDMDRAKQLNMLVKRILKGRELEIIVMRYGLDGQTPRTQREIATEMGISRSYVSRIETKALEMLKAGCLLFEI